MNADNLFERTRKFALNIIKFTESLPRGRVSDHIAYQLLKCGTSVGANYRSACRAKSRADFVSKMGIVEEEADESVFWLQMLTDAGIIEPPKASNLIQEANEITAMTVSSIKTARKTK